jgi:hypothetical protein
LSAVACLNPRAGRRAAEACALQQRVELVQLGDLGDSSLGKLVVDRDALRVVGTCGIGARAELGTAGIKVGPCEILLVVLRVGSRVSSVVTAFAIRLFRLIFTLSLFSRRPRATLCQRAQASKK